MRDLLSLRLDCGRLILATTFIMATPIAGAEPDPNNGKSTGPIVLLPPPEPYSAETGASGTLHLPGSEYRAGDGWWLLACAQGCELISARLNTQSRPHPQYDGEPVPGQELQLVPTPPAGTLLAFKPFRIPTTSLPLQAGPVVSYHPAPNGLRRSTATPGTMEGDIPLPGGRMAHLAPVRLQPGPTASPRESWEQAPAPVLELRIDGRRQTLGSFTLGIEGEVPLNPADYLRWAGDLDGDGRLDLLVQLDFGFGTDLVLYLSSLASPEGLVGEAGRFIYFPIDAAGC